MNMSPRNPCQEETIHKLVKPGRKIIQKTNWASTMCHEMKTSVHSFQTISRSCRSCFSFQQVKKSSCLESLNKRPEMSQLTGEGKENLNKVHPTSSPFLSHNTALLVLTVLSLLEYTLVLYLPIKLCRSAEGPICTQSLYIPAVQGKFPSPLAQSTSWKCPCSSSVTQLLPMRFLHHSYTSPLMLVV